MMPSTVSTGCEATGCEATGCEATGCERSQDFPSIY